MIGEIKKNKRPGQNFRRRRNFISIIYHIFNVRNDEEEILTSREDVIKG